MFVFLFSRICCQCCVVRQTNKNTTFFALIFIKSAPELTDCNEELAKCTHKIYTCLYALRATQYISYVNLMRIAQLNVVGVAKQLWIANGIFSLRSFLFTVFYFCVSQNCDDNWVINNDNCCASVRNCSVSLKMRTKTYAVACVTTQISMHTNHMMVWHISLSLSVCVYVYMR